MTTPEIVRGVALAVHSAPSLAELSQSLPNIVLGLSGCASVSVLFGTSAETSYAVQSSTLSHLSVGATVPSADDPVSQVFREGVPFHAAGEAAVLTWNGEPTPVGACLPLSWQGERYGVLVLHDTVPVAALGDLEALAEQLGLGIVRIQLYEEAARDHRVSLAKLAAIGQTGELLRHLDLETLLVKVMELSLSVVSAQVGSLMIREQDGLVTRVEWGLPDAAILGVKLADGTRAVDDAMDRNDPLLALTLEGDPRFVLEESARGISSLLVIPLSTKEHTIGCLNIVNTEGSVFTPKDLEVLATIAGLASTSIENALLHKGCLERERLSEQLRLAGEIQRKLLPVTSPEVRGAVVEGWAHPCDESGGDYFDFFPLSDTKIGFCVGDVTGHGIGAALLMMTARAVMRSCVGLVTDLGKLLSRLNELLCPDMGGEKFVTLWYGVYDAVERTLTYASAGHDAPLLHRRAKDAVEELDSTGMPLGVIEGVPFGMVKVENLEVGDTLLVMTDGVWEAMNTGGEAYGRERVVAHVRACRDVAPRALLEGLHASVKEFCGEAPQRDDITMVCLRVAPIEDTLGGQGRGETA